MTPTEAALLRQIAELKLKLTEAQEENIKLRRGWLPRCHSCGGWVKPEQGGICLPCSIGD